MQNISDNPLLEDFEKTILRLEDVLKLVKTEVVRDSAIKRFELCFDLSWKCIKLYAKREGVECFSPRDCLKVAYQLGLIDYDETWLKMLDDRNLTVHVYKEKYAEEVYSRLFNYTEYFRKLLNRIKEMVTL